jgi:peroxiredoxin
MARTPSNMMPLGTPLPPFTLTDPTTQVTVNSSDLVGQAVMVVFICNHCPYVKHIGKRLGELGSQYHQQGVNFIAINSNDVANYPDDHPSLMGSFCQEYGITFPYLFDGDQQVAKAFNAACTPDFFLFDRDHQLIYRGQFDGARPSNDVAVSGADLEDAIKAMLANLPIPEDQIPSLGCNIKWLPGNEPG